MFSLESPGNIQEEINGNCQIWLMILNKVKQLHITLKDITKVQITDNYKHTDRMILPQSIIQCKIPIYLEIDGL